MTALPAWPLSGLVRAVNHLLVQQAWARERLRPFAGRLVRWAARPASPLAAWAPPVTVRITDDGLLEMPGRLPQQARVDVSLWLDGSLSMLQDLGSDPDRFARALSRRLHVEGDPMLAAAVGELALRLRWDAEEDLSRWVGDIAAHRMIRGLQGLRDGALRARQAVADVVGRPIRDGRSPLLSVPELERFASELAGLEQRIDALASRIPGRNIPGRNSRAALLRE